MTRRTAILAASAAAAALFPAATAQAGQAPVPSLEIVAAQLSGATVGGYHLNVAVTASCSPGKFDTAALSVRSAQPAATTDDVLECNNQAITQMVTLKSAKALYRTGTPVTITATLRSVENKVLATGTKTVTVQE